MAIFKKLTIGGGESTKLTPMDLGRIPVNGEYTITPPEGYDGISELHAVVDVPDQCVNQDSKQVTPTKSDQTVNPDDGFNALNSVIVKAIPNNYVEPTGTQNVTANGTYNVTNYANVKVAVPEKTYPVYAGETEAVPTGFNVSYGDSNTWTAYYPAMPSEVGITLNFDDGRTEEYYFTANDGVFPSDWTEQTGFEPGDGTVSGGNGTGGYTWTNVVSVNIVVYVAQHCTGVPYLEINGVNVGYEYTAILTEDIIFRNDGGDF